jgi:sigma-B regulation protein RsbU (phosphoserine phosphatase)
MGIQVTDLHLLRDQLLVRREKLGAAIAKTQTASLVQLLEQVDNALERVDTGDFGLCEHCHTAVEGERLLADPLTRVCLDCLQPYEQRALEQDLELASRIQAGLLPPKNVSAAGWQVSYHYQPAGMVSGDYCDVVPYGSDLYFMLGDVSGKGVAASMLMANLHATFRALIPTGLSLPELIGRANRIFSESTLPNQYATLIVGRASSCGEVELCNGGHLPPFHVASHGVSRIECSALPVGMFHDQEFSSTRAEFSPGDSLVLYTDGFTESLGHAGAEYGSPRLAGLLKDHHGSCPGQVLEACAKDLADFRGGSRRIDDQTMMVLNFEPVTH